MGPLYHVSSNRDFTTLSISAPLHTVTERTKKKKARTRAGYRAYGKTQSPEPRALRHTTQAEIQVMLLTKCKTLGRAEPVDQIKRVARKSDSPCLTHSSPCLAETVFRGYTLVQSIPLEQTRGNSIEKWHVHIKAWDSPLYRIGNNHTQRASSPTSMAYTNIILCTQNRRIICVSYHIRGGRVPRTRQFWYTWDKPCTFILRYRDPIFSTLENNPRRAQCGRINRLGHSNSSTYMSQKSHVLYPAPKTKPPIN